MDVGHLKFVVEATRLYITILDGRVQPTLALDELSFNGGLNGKIICTINGRFSIAMLPEDMLMAEDVRAYDHRWIVICNISLFKSVFLHMSFVFLASWSVT